jgi:hypothetical protein
VRLSQADGQRHGDGGRWRRAFFGVGCVSEMRINIESHPSDAIYTFDFDNTFHWTSCHSPDTTMAKSTPGQPAADMFTIIKSTTSTLSPRLARLSLPGRDAIETPHYLGLTSRGVIPHLSQDNFARQTSISGVYAALEDCRSRTQFIPLAPTR